MELKCPFSAPLTQPEFECRFADEVIRRGGSEFNCRSEAAHARCKPLHRDFKQAALPAFGVEDDLLSMPHSVLVKIQFGGLLGLQRLLGTDRDPAEGIADIDALVEQAVTRYGAIRQIPCAEVTQDMLDYRVARRRKR